MMTVQEFIDTLNGVLFEICDAENKLVYSDFLGDQYLENYTEYKIHYVSMVGDHLVITLADYIETPQSCCAVGQKWWATLPPAMGEEIGGLVPCEILETEFGAWDNLAKVTPLRKNDQWGYIPRIVGYEITISRDRLTEQIIEE